MRIDIFTLSVILTGCTTDKGSVLQSAFETQGFVTQTGSVTDFQVEDCEFLDRCFGNNASAPYILFNLPGHADDPTRLPENTVGEVPKVPENMRSQYYLAENEAIVITGQTPPNARYYGLTPYVFTRLNEESERIPVFASLTDTLNQENILAGDAAFESQMAVIYASDSATMASARAALESEGYSDNNINEVVLPRDELVYGTDPNSADTFLMMGRLALVDDAAKGDAYLTDIPLDVFRLTPSSSGEELEVTPRMQRGDGQTEDALAPGLDELEAAIVAAAEQEGTVQTINITSSKMIAQLINPETCIENITECKGDNADTTYAAGPLNVIQSDGINSLAEDEYFVVFGVNHTAAGKSTYSNFSVYTQSKRIGVVAVDSDDMPGSADAYLPDHPDKEMYFTYEIRRDCTDRAFCLTLDTEFPGASLDENLFFIFRAYMNPGMTVSPAHDEILTEGVIHVTPQ